MAKHKFLPLGLPKVSVYARDKQRPHTKYFRLKKSTIKVKVVPDSNDVIAVRNQVLEIDLDNSKIASQTDKVASGSASSGVGVTSPTSYSSSSY